VGLHVALETRNAEPLEPDGLTLRVRVAGGRPPLRVLLYLDGDLVSGCDSVADLYEFRASGLMGARRLLTVRVIDAAGRWGGASTTVGAAAPAAPRGPAPPPRPHVALRSSVRTRSVPGRV